MHRNSWPQLLQDEGEGLRRPEQVTLDEDGQAVRAAHEQALHLGQIAVAELRAVRAGRKHRVPESDPVPIIFALAQLREVVVGARAEVVKMDDLVVGWDVLGTVQRWDLGEVFCRWEEVMSSPDSLRVQGI